MRMAVKQSRCELMSESLKKMIEHALDRRLSGLEDTGKEQIYKDWNKPRDRVQIKVQS